MAITQHGRSYTFTAVNEVIAWPGELREVIAVTVQGTGLTTGQRLTLRDSAVVGSGTILCDGAVEAASWSGDLWGDRGPQCVKGLAIDNNTVAGTWVMTVLLSG